MSDNEFSNGDDQLLVELEDMLSSRAESASELPWLRVSVVSQVEAREKARHWLSSNGSLFRLSSSEHGLKGSMASFSSIVRDLTGQVRNTRFWGTLGAMAGGGGLGYFAASYLSVQEPTPAVVSISLLAAVAGVFAAAAAVQWPYIREFYS